MNTATAPPDPDDVISIRDATSILGISRTTLHRVIVAGQLPAKKLGSRTIILRRDLAAFIDQLPNYK